MHKDLYTGGHWATNQQDNHGNELELVEAIYAPKNLANYVDCSLE